MFGKLLATGGIGHAVNNPGTCQFGSFWSTRMNMQRHFGIAALREDATIRTLMDDLDPTIQVLECDIATEEERAGIFDRSDAKYPMLARTLGTRRYNLKATIAALAQRLATINDKARQAIATAAWEQFTGTLRHAKKAAAGTNQRWLLHANDPRRSRGQCARMVNHR